MKYIIALLILLGSFSTDAQFYKRYKKKRITYAKNTYIGYFGFNRAYYANTNLRVTGPNYDLTIQDAEFRDEPAPLNFTNYFTKHPIIHPQISAKFGLYIKDNLCLSLGYDKFTYNLRNQSRVFLVGVIDPLADSVNYGRFDGAEHIINTTVFNYKNCGMNFIRLDIGWTTPWYKSKSGKINFSSDFNLGVGPVISNNTFLFAGKIDSSTVSLSGGGVALNFGNRLEFRNRLFIQLNLNLGYIGQSHVRTRKSEPLAYSSQNILYSSLNFGVGFFLFGRPINGCDTCPEW